MHIQLAPRISILIELYIRLELPNCWVLIFKAINVKPHTLPARYNSVLMHYNSIQMGHDFVCDAWSVSIMRCTHIFLFAKAKNEVLRGKLLAKKEDFNINFNHSAQYLISNPKSPSEKVTCCGFMSVPHAFAVLLCIEIRNEGNSMFLKSKVYCA